MFNLNAIFKSKECELSPSKCIVEKIITLSDADFESLQHNMLNDYNFISENIGLMGRESNNTVHCLLVLGEMQNDGVLIDSQGYNYPRYSSFIPNAKQIIQAEKLKQDMSLTTKLKDILSCSWEDVHLIHTEVETNPVTIVELSINTLTQEGKHDWSDVLNADVVKVFDGIYGLQIELCNVQPKRLEEFSHMLAGNCTNQDYDRWVVVLNSSPNNTMEPKL